MAGTGHVRKRCACANGCTTRQARQARWSRCEHPYAFVVELPRDAAGRRRQKWQSGFATRKDADRGLRKALSSLDRHRDPFRGEERLDAYLTRWLDQHETQVRARTILRYRQLVDKHLIPHIGAIELAKVTPVDVRGCWERMSRAKLAPATIRQARAVLGKAFNDAIGDGLVDVNPVRAAKSPMVPKPNLVVLRPEHVRALLSHARGTEWALPLTIAAYTGMRRSEVCGLEWGDIDLDAATVTVQRGLSVLKGVESVQAPKSEAGYRTVPLAPALVAVLREHAPKVRRIDGADRVVHCTPDDLTKAFGPLALDAGLPAGARLHDLRHAAAVLMLIEGVPTVAAAELLGHSTAAFTVARYQHVVDEFRGAAASAFTRALG